MNTPAPDEPANPTRDRLDSWKKIAAYLRRDITTVQRWEKREGMPVHRQRHDKAGSVYAFRAELDAWAHSRREPAAPGQLSSPAEIPVPPAPSNAHTRWLVLVIPLLAAACIAAAVIVRMERSNPEWRNPLEAAVYQSVTGFDGENEAAAVSRDGQFVAFLSDRGGRTDVWVTRIGSGQFRNLTAGIDGELANPSIRPLGFSPDGTLVTFWHRKGRSAGGDDISIWAVPTQGGAPKPYLDDVAEAVWSPEGTRLAYHTSASGDPLFVSNGNGLSRSPPILIAPPGLHSHFPVWAPDDLIYFVRGTLPDQLDIWRLGLKDKAPDRISFQSTRITYPVLLDRRTLPYLASAPDGSGPWVYGMDVRRRVPHRVSFGLEQYTSLAATADGHRVIATVSEPERTLWRVGIADRSESPPAIAQIKLTTGTGFAPRLGPGYLLHVAAAGAGESIWKISTTAAVQLWSGADSRITGGPAVSADGRLVAFSVKQRDRSLLYTMASDGSRARILADSLELRGAPAFAPDGLSVTTAADDKGVPRLYNIPLDGGAASLLVHAYSVDPAWSSDGKFVVYSGPDIGTNFTVKASTTQDAAYSLPELTLTRDARHLVLLPGTRQLVFLQGDLRHKNLWSVNLDSGAMQQLTQLPTDFDARDFDISPDGREAILERVQTRSHIVAIDRRVSL